MKLKRKHQPTEAQLTNDPSLKHHPYEKWEAVWSDTHQGLRRYHSHVGWKLQGVEYVWLATVDGMTKLPVAVPENTIRRPTENSKNSENNA